MHLNRRVFVVIQAGAPQLRVIKPESERFDQMEPSPRVGAEPNDVAGIGGDFWMNQHDIKHVDSLMRAGDDEARDRARALLTQCAGSFLERRARRHDVIDQEHGAARNAGAGFEGAL